MFEMVDPHKARRFPRLLRARQRPEPEVSPLKEAERANATLLFGDPR
jgi:hypothetical protein